ncbi:hypothetical protein ACIRQF_04700 [Streptomyces sp. NPDC101191]|uniref:hypothetical protein n=1 Tax=Streptomyces sp. NPDC101191 TaxID=3366126 RepID=UPI0037F61E23
MRTARLAAALGIALIAGLTACTSSPDPQAAATPTVTSDTVPTATTTPTETSGRGGGLPDMIGGSVAGAYSQLTGGLRVEDVSGKGRSVPVDSPAAADWKICTQELAPDGTAVLGAVKKDEDC